jgi:hypothetical protein
MAASFDSLLRALSDAHEAGDVDGARRIAEMMNNNARDNAPSLSTSNPVQPTPPANTGSKVLDFMLNGGAGLISGLRDRGSGVRMFINSLGSDPEGLKRAENDYGARQQQDSAVLATPGGKVGKLVADVAPEIGAGMGVGRATASAGRGMQMLANMLFGAGDAQTNASQNYSVMDNAKVGAAAGLGGDLLGRIVGRGAQFFRPKADATTQEAFSTLMNPPGGAPPMPAPRLTNMTDPDSLVRHATNAIEQTRLPILSSSVTNARNQNLDWFTKLRTAPTGTEVPQLTQDAQRAMYDKLNTTGDLFRNGPDVPMVTLPPHLRQAADDVLTYAQATGQRGLPDSLLRASDALTPAPGSPPMTLTAAQVMDLRRAAGQAAYSATDPVVAATRRGVRDAYDGALKSTLPPPAAAAFDQWLKQWGAMEDVKAALAKGSEGGRLLPQNFDTKFAPTDPLDRITEAARTAIPGPAPGSNRAMVTALMMGGTPLAAGAWRDFTQGDVGGGTAAGAAMSAAILRSLTGKPIDPSTIRLLRSMLTGATVGEVNQNLR